MIDSKDLKQGIACVTGASGMVGRRIVDRLIDNGYHVRVLSRMVEFPISNVEHFKGGLGDGGILKSFVSGAQLMFHCAAEKFDESKMREVNIDGTERLVNIIEEAPIEYLCYISSAGVVGYTEKKWINETDPCNPQSLYERSKWAAEKIILGRLPNCRAVALRPVNIFDDEVPGILIEPTLPRARGKFLRWVRGRETAHLVHAEDVAAAAVHLINHNPTSSIYFVSCDDEPLNTVDGISKLFDYVGRERPLKKPFIFSGLPLWIPQIIRTLRHGKSNRGDVRYSSVKLNSTGFQFPVGFRAAAIRYFRIQTGKPVAETTVLGSNTPLKAVAVLGGSGFIGKHLVKNLAKMGQIQLNVLVHNNQDVHSNPFSNVAFLNGDIEDRDALLKVIEPGSTVVNLVRLHAGSSRLHVKAVECLASVCVERSVRRLIHCSTANVVGDFSGSLITENTTCRPKGRYNLTNFEIEKVLRTKASRRFEIVVLRPTMVFGKEGQNLIKMVEDLKRNHWLIKYLRSCLYYRRRMNLVGVNNVVDALKFLITTDDPVNQKVFILSDDEDPNNNYRYVEKKLIRAMNLPGYPLPLIPLPLVVLQLTLILSGRDITHPQRRYEWRSLKKAGYRKKMPFTKALSLFISELDKAQSS